MTDQLRRSTDLTPVDRCLAGAGIVGPVGFVLAWSVAGLAATGYSAFDDAISELAQSGAPTRAAMTVGFLCFGVFVPLFSLALRRALPGSAWIAAATSGLATIGAAAFALGTDPAATIHGVFAGIGYVGLALTPLLAAPAFARDGQRSWAVYSVLTGGISGLCLLFTLADVSHGAFQRVGLTATDLWLVVAAVTILRRGTLVDGSPGSRLHGA